MLGPDVRRAGRGDAVRLFMSAGFEARSGLRDL